MKELTYRRATIDDTKVLLPNLTLDSRSEAEKTPIGQWGLKRRDDLETTNLSGLYLIRGTLPRHLEEVQKQAEALEQAYETLSAALNTSREKLAAMNEQLSDDE